VGNTYLYLIVFCLLLWVIWMTQRDQQAIIKKFIKNKRKKRMERVEMVELAKRFVGKECIIYTFNSQINGTIKEVSDGAILLDNKGTEEAVNVDFIIRIREYPTKKNGKKKSVILD